MKTYGEWIEVVSTDPAGRVFLRFDLGGGRSHAEKIDVALLGIWSDDRLIAYLDGLWNRK